MLTETFFFQNVLLAIILYLPILTLYMIKPVSADTSVKQRPALKSQTKTIANTIFVLICTSFKQPPLLRGHSWCFPCLTQINQTQYSSYTVLLVFIYNIQPCIQFFLLLLLFLLRPFFTSFCTFIYRTDVETLYCSKQYRGV